MSVIFWRQLRILIWKNWMVLTKHTFINTLRCLILPVAYGVFLQYAQGLLARPDNYGLGSPVRIPRIVDEFDGSEALVWVDATNGSGFPPPDSIMSKVTSGFTPTQLAGIKKVAAVSDIPFACPQNFDQVSECFAAIVFNNIPAATGDIVPISYTLQSDGSRAHIDVVRHIGDFEQQILPLQWAVDQAIIEIQTGIEYPTPLELPFSKSTNEEQRTDFRLQYIRGIRKLICLAFFICYIGIAYQLPGAFADERARLLTSHMKAMGLGDSARIISWHISITLAYLPAWIVVALVWRFCIFLNTHVLLVLAINSLLGLSLASWSFFTAVPFGQSPQLAAIVSTLLAVGFAILALVYDKATTAGAFIFSIIFPPGFYIFAIRAVCGFENNLVATNALVSDPDNHLLLFPLLIAASINVFLWPYLAVLLERRLYDARNPSTRPWSLWPTPKYCRILGKRSRVENYADLPPNTAISIRNLEKRFSTSMFRRDKGLVTAIADLTLDIPKFGIFVVLGSNGAGKSTTMSIIGGLLGSTSGTVTFEGGEERPPRGTLGIVPQKNVLFPELTCYQTLRVWSAIKRTIDAHEDEDLVQLLRDCDLEKKTHANANTLSGGQKRKLQLAIGLVGGSKTLLLAVVLVDECTSGIDPLSRRAIWRILGSFRRERTIVFTTHFLDEADLLADNIAVLAVPGKLVANGSPVTLKTTYGEGYSIQVKFSRGLLLKAEHEVSANELLPFIRDLAPDVYVVHSSFNQATYHLRSKDPITVEKVLLLLDSAQDTFGVASYDVLSTSIEDIFLRLMNPCEFDKLKQDDTKDEAKDDDSRSSLTAFSVDYTPGEWTVSDDTQSVSKISTEHETLTLVTGLPRPPWSQALVIFHKRVLIARRSWLATLLLVVIAVAGSTVPTFFMAGRPESCVPQLPTIASIPLYLPISPINPTSPANHQLLANSTSPILTQPPDIASTLGITSIFLRTTNFADNATFINYINENYRNINLGGVSFDLDAGTSLFAWETTLPGLIGSAMLNLVTNILFNRALQASGKAGPFQSLIIANYETFPFADVGFLGALKWVTFFGATMAVYTAFFALYVSQERCSSVQAMQLSNGLSNPIGLWLGHLLFDSIFVVIASTLITIILATTSDQFHGLGLFWIVLVLFGIVGALFAYCVSLFMTSPLSAFAVTAGYEIGSFLVYLVAYLLTFSFAGSSKISSVLTIINFTLSFLSPIASVMRASFISINLFSLLCDGTTPVNSSSLGGITKFGGPILYLIFYGFCLFLVLVLAESGSILPKRLPSPRRNPPNAMPHLPLRSQKEDVITEARAVSTSNDLLRILKVTKSYGKAKVVDHVSLGVSRDTIFALLGPSGAGKTISFSMVSGDVKPDDGDVFINGVSVVHQPRIARLSLGVCPQFTAIDPQLTVREHLMVYGRLKGLGRAALHRDVESLMHIIKLAPYAERLASKLSGGNQRKLSLAIAIIGNPSVLLIDEFSTGVDPKMKREMWETLRTVAAGKAVVITTHSMEEATALANKVGILAKHMLAVGTCEELSARYANYEVHFACRSREDVMRAQALMSKVPGSRMADDVATRFEVPNESEGGLPLARLFQLLASKEDFPEYTVERATLESVFLKVIRENNVLEEDGQQMKRCWWQFW